ncbi:hypothetical protein AV654_06285 [Paenibacillus elgii]|uniref:ABC transporter domain-containing protein n=1 Tax=Paenibacillus elgii TaxID=189691 RepID=A0A163SZG0_9BACL|nr:ABC transporter ATP-binding protein [Paenibacillus elgii]KZE70489.1 hypothetical protein AV654_06285 [Paenibacillus elgii]
MTYAIEMNHIWKKYKIYQDKPSSLKERFLYRSKGVFQEKWVLEDICLALPKGKMVGLIGRNGSGKSTLLKIMTRILQPDHGELIVRGRVSSLLELGAGFHMDFTGRENIYMNASLFGLSRKEISKIINDIIHFSELDNFIDNPVRTYSSGMYMRLAFSIAIHVNPDVLLIDEILAVGDSAFQKKCIHKIEEFKRVGTTIVFVSHDLGSMERLCDEVYWIDQSKIREKGNPRDIIRNYLTFLTSCEEERLKKEIKIETGEQLDINDSLELKQNQEGKRWGSRAIEITKVDTFDEFGDIKHVFHKGSVMNLKISYKLNVDNIEHPAFGVGIFRADGACCYGTNTFIDKIPLEIKSSGSITFRINSLNLIQGQYYLDVASHHIDGTPYDYITKILEFQVNSYEDEAGIAFIPHIWVMEDLIDE